MTANTIIPFTGSPAVAPPPAPEIGDDLFEQARDLSAELEFVRALVGALDNGMIELRRRILQLAQTRKEECRNGNA